MSAQLITLGETMAALRAVDSGSSRIGDLFELDVAGAESSVAVGVVRLGGTARYIGRVGDDDAGRAVERALRGEGVELDLHVDPDRPTGMLLATSPRPGRSRVSYGRAQSAGSRLEPADVDEAAIAAAEILHVTGITLALSESCRAAVMRAIAIARANATLVSFDVNYRSRLWGREEAAAVLRQIIPHTDILFAGLDEGVLLSGTAGAETGRSPERLGASLQSMGAATVILTEGEAGAWFRAPDGGLHRQPALPVTAMVDSTGAGDAFVSGYLADLLAGASVEERLFTAAVCGARACEVRGDWRNAPTRRDVDAGASTSAAQDPVDR